MKSDITVDTPALAAAEWFIESREPGFTPETRKQFEAWLAQDVRHRQAYEGVKRAWDVTGKIPEYLRRVRRRQLIGVAWLVSGLALFALTDLLGLPPARSLARLGWILLVALSGALGAYGILKIKEARA